MGSTMFCKLYLLTSDDTDEFFLNVFFHALCNLAWAIGEFGPDLDTEDIRSVVGALIEESYAAKFVWFRELPRNRLEHQCFPHLLHSADWGGEVDPVLPSVLIYLVFPFGHDCVLKQWKCIDALFFTLDNVSLNRARDIIAEEVFYFAVFDVSPGEGKGNNVVEPGHFIHTLFVVVWVLVVQVLPQNPLCFKLKTGVNGIMVDFFCVIFCGWLIWS